MFNNIKGFEKIGEDIFVYKNFVSVSELNTIQNVILNLTEEQWNNGLPGDHWLCNKISNPNKTLNFIRERIISFLPEGYFLGNGKSFVKLFKGDSWGPHADAHDFYDIRKKAAQLKENEPYQLADNEKWGLVVYFNDFEGGSLYYPNQNIEYKPNAGDLVIHSAEEHCLHGVKPVLSEIRYSHSNHIFDKIKVPIE
jgi:hypothetical protein